MLLLFRLQEVKAAPLKFVTDLAFEDSWSHLFMNTLAPLGYIKVLILTDSYEECFVYYHTNYVIHYEPVDYITNGLTDFLVIYI